MQETYAATASQLKIQGAKRRRNNPSDDCVKWGLLTKNCSWRASKPTPKSCKNQSTQSALPNKSFPPNDQCSTQQGNQGPNGNSATPTQSKDANLWGKSYTKELGQLSQGIPGTKGTFTIAYIKYDKILLDWRRNVTYSRTVVGYQPEKDDSNRTRLTVGGNRIVCSVDVSTPTVEMITVKMHLNSII